MESANYRKIKEFSFSLGASLFGAARLDRVKGEFLLSKDELQGMEFGISIGVVLSKSVLMGIVDGPTLLYKWHYRQANNLLDKIAFLVTKFITDLGHRALPIPASQIVDWDKQRGHISHRTVAEAAGIGWRGRNNLIVNEKYGSAIRLVSVLTDIPLSEDSPVQNMCGSCRRCISVCPAGALGETWREYDLNKCYSMLTEFSKRRGIGQHICGICVKECYKRRE